jgi:hypothetical protein
MVKIFAAVKFFCSYSIEFIAKNLEECQILIWQAATAVRDGQQIWDFASNQDLTLLTFVIPDHV